MFPLAPQGIERRLAAILVADVVAYSRLMGQDEAGTLAQLKSHRKDLIDPKIAEHHGRVVKLMGDGTLVEFASVAEAVKCAVEIQRAMARRNAGVDEERRIEFRIGINLGDVIVDGEDIYGNGVNVAARLQEIALPGGICASGNVYEHVHNMEEIGFEDLGEQEVKNIAEPVRTYCILIQGSAGLTTPKIRPERPMKWWAAVAMGFAIVVAAAAGVWNFALRDRPPTMSEARTLSVVVLPFNNISGDSKQDYIADGITEDLITDLTRIRDTFVIARNTSFSYKGQSVDAQQVSQELNVRFVLTGSVRRSADQLRVNAQLINGETGAQVWSDRFDREFKDVFSLQNDITGRIAAALRLELLEAESARLRHGPPENLEAWDYALRGWAELWTRRISEESVTEARKQFEHALELDERLSLAWSGMARVYFVGGLYPWGKEPRGESFGLALEAAEKAVALDPKSAEAHYQLGMALRVNGRYGPAENACATAIELNPSNEEAYTCLALLKTTTAKYEEALQLFEASMRLSPRLPTAARRYYFIGWTHFLAGQYEDAVKVLEKGVAASPDYPPLYWALAASFGWLGRDAEAQAALARWMDLDKGLNTIEKMRNRYDYIADRERMLEGLRRAGMPEE